MLPSSPSNPPPHLGTAIITGAGHRLGSVIALHLAKQGYDCLLHYRRSHQEVIALQQTIQSLGRNAQCFACDFALANWVNDWAQALAEITPLKPSVLVNNASLFEYDQPHTTTPDSLLRHYQVNTLAPVMLTQWFAQYADRTHPFKPCVINLLDHKLDFPNPDYFAYTLAKGALATATIAQAMHYAPDIRVCGVSPGIVFPNAQMGEEKFTTARTRALLGQSGSAEDVAQAVLFLARNASMTGEIIVVDGGQRWMGLTRDASLS